MYRKCDMRQPKESATSGHVLKDGRKEKYVTGAFTKSQLRGAGSVSIGEAGAVSGVAGVSSGWHWMNAGGSRRPHPSPARSALVSPLALHIMTAGDALVLLPSFPVARGSTFFRGGLGVIMNYACFILSYYLLPVVNNERSSRRASHLLRRGSCPSKMAPARKKSPRGERTSSISLENISVTDQY